MARLLTLLLVLLTAPAAAAPRAELWDRWLAHDPAGTTRVDHEPWRGFLLTYLRPGEDGINRVAYAEVTAADHAALAAYLDSLARVEVDRLRRDEQMAFWINLYNALTVRVVLEHYPVASIREIDISPGLFSNGPWGARLVTVAGEPLSLDDIEHRILRPIWRDPRVHYAVNCAALTGPNLQPEPFAAASLDAMLDRAAIAFVNHRRGVSIGADGVRVSSIYRWFQADFGGDEAGVLRHLMAYAAPSLALTLQRLDAIQGYGYDWSLNDAASAGR